MARQTSTDNLMRSLITTLSKSIFIVDCDTIVSYYIYERFLSVFRGYKKGTLVRNGLSTIFRN